MRARSSVRRTAAAVALAAATVLGACGGDDGRFDASADDVRRALDAGDRAAAIAAVDALAVEGLAAHETGALDDAELDEFARRIESLRSQIDALLPPPPPPPPPPTTTAPATVEPRDDEDEDEDEDEGKGRGRKKKDDD